MSHPMSSAATAAVSPTPLYYLAVLAAILTVLARPVSASAQEGFGNYAAAAGAAAAEESPRLSVPYDARASVRTPGARTHVHRPSR
jgi:hypothetical protein